MFMFILKERAMSCKLAHNSNSSSRAPTATDEVHTCQTVTSRSSCGLRAASKHNKTTRKGQAPFWSGSYAAASVVGQTLLPLSNGRIKLPWAPVVPSRLDPHLSGRRGSLPRSFDPALLAMLPMTELCGPGLLLKLLFIELNPELPSQYG